MKKLIQKSTALLIAAQMIFCTALVSFASNQTAPDKSEINVYYRVYDNNGENGSGNYHWEDKNGNTVSFDSYSHTAYGVDQTFPSYYSSADKGYVTPVENQGSTSLCWAYSTLSTIGSYGLKKGIASSIEEADFSEAHLGWFSSTASTDINDPLYGEVNQFVESGGPYKTGGDWKQGGVFLAAGKGLAPQDSYYDAVSMPPLDESSRYDRSAGYLTDMEKICEYPDNDIIKASIISYGAVKASYYNTITNKYKNNNEYNSDTYAYYNPVNNGEPTNHAISIVGWDDDFPKENFINQPSGNGAWLAKNSWGTLFGDKGYFWISYYDATLTNFVRFSYVDGSTYDNIYQYDGDDIDLVVSKDSVATAEQANVFTADSNEKLKAIGFTTIQNNISVQIKVYRNLPENFSSPTDGTLVDSVYSSAVYEGYHTVDLNKEIELETDEIFSVVITYSSNEALYLPVNTGNEYHSGNGYINFYVHNPDWQSAGYYAETANANVCIKAYTSNIPEPSDENARKYTVNYFTEDLNGNYVLSTETHYGYAGETAKVSARAEKGLSVDKQKSTLSGVIADDGSLILNVYLRRESFEIEFICGDLSKKKVLKYGEKIVPPDFEKTGYTSEWENLPETMPGCNLTVTGSFVSETYTISWVVNGKTIFNHKYAYGETIKIPELPANIGGTFLGWDISIPTTMPAKDLVINAVYSWKSYEITWIWNGETKTETVEYGSKIVPPQIPDPSDDTEFYGWNASVPDTMPAKNLTFTAVYGPKRYNAVYVIDGVEYATAKFTLETEKSDLISNVSLPEKAGYKIEFDDFEISPNDIIISGRFVPIEYSITFVADGEVISKQYFNVENIDTIEIIEPVAPPKAGYVNSRWSYYQLQLEDITVIPRYDSPCVTSSSRKTVSIGTSFELIASCNFERTLKVYKSNNTEVAVIDSNGKIKAVGKGECFITVTCYGYDETGNEISASATVKVIVNEKLSAENLPDLLRELFYRFFEVTLHDLAYNFKNLIYILLKSSSMI